MLYDAEGRDRFHGSLAFKLAISLSRLYFLFSLLFLYSSIILFCAHDALEYQQHVDTRFHQTPPGLALQLLTSAALSFARCLNFRYSGSWVEFWILLPGGLTRVCSVSPGLSSLRV